MTRQVNILRLVQTLENNPAIIHGGPFANIAHGCNSIIATKTSMQLSDYVVTEAGFGADLGAEKFLDIKCRKGELVPSAVVLVATIRALKMHGGVNKKDLQTENVGAVIEGTSNLKRHIENLQKFGIKTDITKNQFRFLNEDKSPDSDPFRAWLTSRISVALNVSNRANLGFINPIPSKSNCKFCSVSNLCDVKLEGDF